VGVGRLTLAVLVGTSLVLPACRRERAPPPSLRLSTPYVVDSLDPHGRDLLAQLAVAAHFYDGLVRADTELRITPALAERWITPEPTKWVFHLRPGVRFHDGRPLEAADVVATFERLRRDPALQVGGYASDVESVTAPSPSVVEIRTRRPTGMLLSRLARIAIVPRDAGPELRERPRGTGPYRLVGREPDRLRLERFAEHWGPPPNAASVELLLGRGETAWRDVLEGRSDAAACGTRECIAAANERPDVRVVPHAGISLRYLGFDVASEASPFRDRRLRQAVSLAVDRAALVRHLGGAALAANQLVPPAIFGFDPRLPPSRHAPDEARALVDAVAPGGLDVELSVRSVVGQAAEPLRAMLAAAGIRVRPVPYGEREFFDLVTRRPTLYLSRYGCDTGDAADVLNAGIHSGEPAQRLGTANTGGYRDPAIDRAIEDSATILEPGARVRRLQEIMGRLADELPWVPLYFEDEAYVVRSSVRFKPRADGHLLAQELLPVD
jgi:peptide/nickel transport system substrate-binding protein